MNTDPQVTAYVDALPEPDRSTLDAWRGLCRTLPHGFTEEFRYGMPCYARAGEAELGLARQKRHPSPYVTRTDVVASHRDRLAGYSVGKGCIRFAPGRPSDLDLVASLVDATGSTTGPVC